MTRLRRFNVSEGTYLPFVSGEVQRREPALRALPHASHMHPLPPWRMAQWVVRRLPPVTAGQRYVEPYAGMAAVLLNRGRASFEMLNDSDEVLVNWWRVLQRRPDEFAHQMAHTPRARRTYERAHDVLRRVNGDTLDDSLSDDEQMEAAWAFTVVVEQSTARHHRSSSAAWCALEEGQPTRSWGANEDVVSAVVHRLADVRLECADPVSVLSDYLADPDAVVHVAPSHVDANRSVCDHQEHELIDRLLDPSVRARVAVTGRCRPSCWPALNAVGWVRHQRAASGTRDALWMNYEPTWLLDNNPLRLLRANHSTSA